MKERGQGRAGFTEEGQRRQDALEVEGSRYTKTELKAASVLKGAARATQGCCWMHSETRREARKPGLYHGRLCTAFTIFFLKYFTEMGASEQ